tara:strand:- start:3366 stop:4382 length:1017 start_codon:yes stop_codon:yes gene_type:complete
MQKKDNWFTNYQTIGNVRGQRDINYRKNYLKKEDFINKDVIDIGCNIGQMCFFSKELGAKNVLGIEYDKEAVKIANGMNKDSSIYFQTDDIDNYFLYTSLPEVDTILLLSVIGTCELTNKNGILSKLSQKAKKVMYIEGHHSVMKYKELFDMIIRNTTFTTIEYMGETYDNADYERKKFSRALFRCSREELNQSLFNEKIYNTIQNNNESLNAITGHGGSGKSFILDNLIKFLENEKKIVFKKNIDNNRKIYKNEEYKIIITDDIPSETLLNVISGYKHKLIFDYRAVEYIKNNDITNLFYVKSDIKTRIKNRPQYQYDRSLPIDAKFIKNIYHISNM